LNVIHNIYLSKFILQVIKSKISHFKSQLLTLPSHLLNIDLPKFENRNKDVKQIVLTYFWFYNIRWMVLYFSTFYFLEAPFTTVDVLGLTDCVIRPTIIGFLPDAKDWFVKDSVLDLTPMFKVFRFLTLAECLCLFYRCSA
jgi:hypothetical protein